MNKLQELELKRKEYVNIKWKSSSGISTRIIDLDDSYLMNVMKSISKSLVLANHFPVVKEFQSYDKVKYTDYQKYLQTEYLYRQELVEARYKEYIDQQIYEQSQRDLQYYDDRYDYGTLGNLY